MREPGSLNNIGIKSSKAIRERDTFQIDFVCVGREKSFRRTSANLRNL